MCLVSTDEPKDGQDSLMIFGNGLIADLLDRLTWARISWWLVYPSKSQASSSSWSVASNPSPESSETQIDSILNMPTSTTADDSKSS